MLEIVTDHASDTYRAIYTVKFATAIYVLHAFQKKSKTGAKTPAEDMELIARRLKAAEADYRMLMEKGKKIMTKVSESSVKRGTRNIFADLGFVDAETHLLKAGLVNQIQEIVTAHGLTQTAAGKHLGISQPDVSRLLKGQFRDVSVERLMRLLTRLGCDVDIVIRDQGKKSAPRETLHLLAG